MPINKSLIQEVIGKTIKDLRDSKGVTQDFLAKHLDISRPTLISYENGKQPISIGDIYILADFFEIEISMLLPTLKDMTKMSCPETQLDLNPNIPSGSKEEIKEFILEKIRKG